jgi:hypothetical protein
MDSLADKGTERAECFGKGSRSPSQFWDLRKVWNWKSYIIDIDEDELRIKVRSLTQ